MITINKDGEVQKGMLSVKELAVYFGVSVDTVYRMVDNNEISYLTVKGQIRFPVHHIEGYVEKNLVKKAS